MEAVYHESKISSIKKAFNPQPHHTSNSNKI